MPLLANRIMNGSLNQTRIALVVLAVVALGISWSVYFHVSDVPRDEMVALIERLRPIRGLSVDEPLIRLGEDSDGGYLIPNDIDGIEVVFSPGVAAGSTFESSFASKGATVYMADASVDGPAEENEKFHFVKKFLGPTTEGVYITLQDWVEDSISKKSIHDGNLVLQMDIEGWEVDTLNAAPAALVGEFRILLLEVHHLSRMWSRSRFRKMKAMFDKILKTHSVVHIHPNNCCGIIDKNGVTIPDAMEFTFLRNGRVTDQTRRVDFPHRLDRRNMAQYGGDLPLPSIWYTNQ